jgi:hypothetical protein
VWGESCCGVTKFEQPDEDANCSKGCTAFSQNFISHFNHIEKCPSFLTSLLLFLHVLVLILNAWYISVAPWIDPTLQAIAIIMFIASLVVFAVYVVCQSSKCGYKFFSYILCLLRLSHIQTTFNDDRRRIFFYNAISLLVLQDFP